MSDLPFNSSPIASSVPLTFCTNWLNELFTQAGTVWVGFSGGVDSHVLLHALVKSISSEQRHRLGVVHVHHGLSSNADSWQVHCEGVCQDLGVRFVAHRVQLEAQASIEDAARNARYMAFQETLGANDVLLLAHHAGDQVETVLFRLLRGSGGKGLAGMPKARKLGESRLIRPLLGLSKADIEHYAHQQKLEWIQDESNDDMRFTRNFLRNQVLPVLSSRFPHLEKSIASTAQRIATDYAMLEQFSAQQLDVWCNESGGFPLSYLNDKPLDERLFWLRQFLQTKHISLPQSQLESVNAMMLGAEDKQPELDSLRGRICRHKNVMYVLPSDQPAKIGHLKDGEVFERAFDSLVVSGGDVCELKYRPQGATLLMPNGRHRKLKKWLNDASIPSWWREHLPYVFIRNELIAIGDLWRHPDYSHIDIEWRKEQKLPFPQ